MTKIDPGDGKGSFNIKQGVGDIKAGMEKGGDMSRVSAYRGPNEGVHTGSSSETLGRGGSGFGKK